MNATINVAATTTDPAPVMETGLAPQWSNIVKTWPAERKLATNDALVQDARAWHVCAVGEALDLADVPVTDSVLGEAVRNVDGTLFDVGGKFSAAIAAARMDVAALALDQIEDQIGDRGGHAHVRELVRKEAMAIPGRIEAKRLAAVAAMNARAKRAAGTS